jgi:hypothetical protein
MQKSHFFLSPVQVFDGPNLKVAMTRALVSQIGVHKVFEESEEVRRAFLSAREYSAKIDGQEYRARLVRESDPYGTIYNLRLLGGESSAYLRKKLNQSAITNPWRRTYARIASKMPMSTEFPVAVNFSRFSGKFSAEVSNFSYRGLFLQLDWSSLVSQVGVNQNVKIQIITSKGRHLEAAVGRIARLYDEMPAPGSMQRGVGLQLLEIPEPMEKAYQSMILDACRLLRTAAE